MAYFDFGLRKTRARVSDPGQMLKLAVTCRDGARQANSAMRSVGRGFIGSPLASRDGVPTRRPLALTGVRMSCRAYPEGDENVPVRFTDRSIRFS